MLRMPSKNDMNNIRDLFAREHKEKVPPDLRHALTLLHLNGYKDLEDRLLSTEAFIRPWSVFRDSVYLLSPDAVPRATQVIPIGTESGDGVSRLDILWFYTQFDEGTLRYDSRADKYSADYTSNVSFYGLIDKSKWRVEEHEKLLYAWLLQEFKVGKGYSPWRFESFELKNICTVWEEVFVPIVNAVRTAYHPMGRRHYGRLALFIEARCPSSLAFPSSNIGVLEGEKLSPTPYRVVSMPKKMTNGAGTTSYYHHEFAQGVLTKKNYDTTEKELRDVYPQYGGLVERPKFKHKMEEWLAEQRARADRRKAQEKHGRVQSFQARIVQRNGSHSPVKQPPQSPRGSLSRRQDQHQRSSSARGEGSQIKRYSDNMKRSFSNTMSSMRREEQKSPLHGVTRQLHFPERTSSLSHDSARDPMVITPLPRPQQQREASEVSVFTSIRNSNPFSEGMPDEVKTQRVRAGTNDSIFSPMGQLSAIPRPLQPESEAGRDVEPVHQEHPVVQPKKSYHDVRIPSYEGTEYEKEISLTDLHTRRMNAARSPEPARTRTPATRLPAPIVPIPYGGPRVASADTPSKGIVPLPKPVLSPPKPVTKPVEPILSPPKPVAPPVKPVVAAPKSIAWPGPPSTKPKATAWPDSPSPKPKITAWPGFESDDEEEYFPPPVPSKSPERHIRNPRSRQLLREERDHEVFRIVSRENIRTALGSLTRESSTEELAPPKFVAEPARTMSPMKHPLQTYNTHLFPRKDERKGTPVGERVKGDAEKGRYDPGGAYELEVLHKGMEEH